MEFMPEHAPLVVLAFWGTLGLLAFTAMVFVFGTVRRYKWVALGAAAFGAVVAGSYALLLVAVSLTSHEKVLAAGGWKYFCEIDCHVAYSVSGVDEAQSLGDESHPVNACGRFVIVRLKTWFDPSTTNPHRGDSLLTPNPRRVLLVDERRREFFPSPAGQTAFVTMRGATPPLTQPLRPGESYESVMVFDVPANAQNLRFFLTDSTWLEHFMIGHELSPFHARIYLGLSRPGLRTRSASPTNSMRFSWYRIP